MSVKKEPIGRDRKINFTLDSFRIASGLASILSPLRKRYLRKKDVDISFPGLILCLVSFKLDTSFLFFRNKA